MSFSFRYRLFASVFVLYSSLCGALDRARPTPNFARVSPALFTTFLVPGAVGTYPTSINDSETVTGYYTEPAGTQAVLFEARMEQSRHSRCRAAY